MWRISDDFWDHWGPWPGHDWSQGLRAQFDTAAKWAATFAKPGRWPDADMLPLGRLGPHPGEGQVRDTLFSRDEQRTMMPSHLDVVPSAADYTAPPFAFYAST
jgi:hypothetical protein